MKGIPFLAALVAAVIVLVSAGDAEAQLLRRRSSCGNGFGVSSGCNVGSQGCNISSAPQTRATAEDLLEQVSAAKTREIAPVLPAKEIPLVIDEAAALAFCAPVERDKHQLDLEKVVYHKRPPVGTVASR